MTDERSTPQGVIAQAYAVRCTSPPPPAPSSATSPQQQQQQQQQQHQSQLQSSPPRGPRTLLLRRSENGFGFTLRHFIVYPPESCCVLPGHERTRIDEPMDTIFVKQVRLNSPAAEAGLRTGDRVVSVDGAPTRGEQYASVVQRIQQAGSWLRLLVVSKEDDILQRYFGETAHNPETNQRPGRHRSPERISQKNRRSMSMIPGPLPRSRQSWVCQTSPGSENHGTGGVNEVYRVREDGYKDQQASMSNKMNVPTVPPSLNTVQRRQPLTEASRNQETVLYGETVDDKSQQNRQSFQQEGDDLGAQPYTSSSDSRFDLYDRTRPESIYSRPSSEQIYDRIKDPIYERVRPGLTSHSKSLDQQCYPISRAEPQVPIYRPGRRIVTRRASEGSGTINDSEIAGYGSLEAMKTSNPGSRLSVDLRRDSSPASKDSLSSYDSNSTLTGNECSDDSVIMTRLRKSFEQKEEFLRRPSHPTGWLLPDETARATHGQGVIQREFYARPQKLQRQMWPPNEQVQQQQQMQQQPQQQQQQQQSPTRNTVERTKNSKPSNQNVQRVRTDMDSESEYINQSPRSSQNGRINYDGNGVHHTHAPTKTTDSQFRNVVVASPRIGNNNKAAFVTTLSRIHENVTSANQQQQQQNECQSLRNGTSSLPSSPGPEKKSSEKFSVPPQGLQIVSRRAKQFESGRLLSDDDEPTSDRTNLYKSELSRLSSKRSVPNVAVRKREFELKAESQDLRRIVANRESKSLDSEILAMDTAEPVQMRARSNSAESWEAVNGGFQRRGNRPTWQRESEEQECKRISKAKRQDSYLQAVRTQLERLPQSCAHRETESESGKRPKSEDLNAPFFPTTIEAVVSNTEGPLRTPTVNVSPPQPVRPTQLPIPYPLWPLEVDNQDLGTTEEPLLAPASSGCANGVVLRRQKNAQLSDEERATRRVSYLKATWGERMHVDSDLELSDSEPAAQALRSAHRRWRPPLFPGDITPLRRIFEDVTQAAHLHRHYHRNSISSGHGATCVSGIPKDIEPVEREGSLHVKFTMLDSKRSTDRSWKQVWGVLRGPILYFYKDRHSQSPSATNDGEAGQNVDVRCSLVDVADDYTKRKHVLRVANPSAELLLQTEDAVSMALWLRAFHKHAVAEKPSDANSSTSKQQAVPQVPGPTTPSTAIVQAGGQRLSPLPSHKGIRKLTSFRTRSPTGQSPVNKTRKPSQTVEPLPSPKTKTWKGRVAKQLRKMHGQAGSPSSPTAQLPPEGATFKVPLELCPMSSFSEFVPLIVEMCTSIVEARGLEVIGIYRVPGNTAAISQLTESVNKGFENINLQDPRWSDVNVISSLLKSFFRQLPDSLLTADLYPMFIDADKVEDPQRRMATIRKLLRDLPEHHFETLKHLMLHLKRVVEHSEINKMEAKNLAIVFGPTLVRASGSRDNMVTMVTDMSHQCRIVESLLNNVDWFFCEEDLDDLSRLSVNLSLPADGSEVETTSTTNHNLLLNNIQKVEGMREMVSARDIVSSIISAANRKIQRRRKGHDDQESEDHEDEKAKAKQEAEALATIRASMALNDRQCSVSEIVLMHENKNQTTNLTEPSAERSIVVSNPNGLSNPMNGSMSNRLKYSTSPQSNQQQQSQHSNVASGIDSSRLSSDVEPLSLDTISTMSNSSNDTKQSNDEVAIRTYAGLSATTKERIRKFEQETKAMLQRDQHRQRREAEKREEERRKIEMEWQLAKREMENDDILDGIVDDATTAAPYISERLSNLNDRLFDHSSAVAARRKPRSRSTTRVTPLSIAVQQEPITRQKAEASSQLSSILGEKINNGIIKKFKIDKEPSLESVCLAPTRYGSLDSLHDVHSQSHPSPSPSQQTRGFAGDISDDGAGCAPTKTPAPQSRPQPRTGPTSCSSAASSSSSPQPPSPPPPPPRSQLSEPGLSGTGAGPSSKTLNKFLRGSDLLTSLTSTFDRKWKSLVNPSNLLMTSAESVDASVSDTNRREEKNQAVEKNEPLRSAEVYRDPSLHKSLTHNTRLMSPLNKRATEKDMDSNVRDSTAQTYEELTTPDNDRFAGKKSSEAITDSTGECSGILDAADKDESLQSSVNDRAQCVIKPKYFEMSKSEEDTAATSVFRRDIDHQEQLHESTDNEYGQKEIIADSSYSNKLEKFESLSQANTESRSRLKRSESLNKRCEMASSKLKRSESLNKHPDRLTSPTNGKLKRSESLNKHADRSESPNTKLKRSESLSKTEKTECNISKRRQSIRKESTTKLKRKNGMPERSIKRRHTVGGTKDFDKVHWLDNKLQLETERVIRNDTKPKKSQLRTSSPDLSSNRVHVTDTSFLIEVSFRGPSNVVFNVTNTRPQSLPDANLASKVFKVPLESHV